MLLKKGITKDHKREMLFVTINTDEEVVFIMRICGINQISPKVRKVLQLLRLRQINNRVFIKMNKATQNMLRIAEPYVTYGCPNLKSVHDLCQD